MFVFALGGQPRLYPVGLPAGVVHNVRVPHRRQFTGDSLRRVSGGARTVDDDLRALVGQQAGREFPHAVGREVDRAGQVRVLIGHFDRVLSSLVFHHLTREDKARAFREVYRVLRAGGELHFADFGKPQNALMRAASLPWRLFDGRETTRDNVRGELPALLRDAGFAEVCETARHMTLFGTLSLYQARKLR